MPICSYVPTSTFVITSRFFIFFGEKFLHIILLFVNPIWRKVIYNLFKKEKKNACKRVREGIAKLKKDSPLTCHWTQKQNTRTAHLCAWCLQAKPADINVDDVTRQFDKERESDQFNQWKAKSKTLPNAPPCYFSLFHFPCFVYRVRTRNQSGPDWIWNWRSRMSMV